MPLLASTIKTPLMRRANSLVDLEHKTDLHIPPFGWARRAEAAIRTPLPDDTSVAEQDPDAWGDFGNFEFKSEEAKRQKEPRELREAPNVLSQAAGHGRAGNDDSLREEAPDQHATRAQEHNGGVKAVLTGSVDATSPRHSVVSMPQSDVDLPHKSDTDDTRSTKSWNHAPPRPQVESVSGSEDDIWDPVYVSDLDHEFDPPFRNPRLRKHHDSRDAFRPPPTDTSTSTSADYSFPSIYASDPDHTRPRVPTVEPYQYDTVARAEEYISAGQDQANIHRKNAFKQLALLEGSEESDPQSAAPIPESQEERLLQPEDVEEPEQYIALRRPPEEARFKEVMFERCCRFTKLTSADFAIIEDAWTASESNIPFRRWEALGETAKHIRRKTPKPELSTFDRWATKTSVTRWMTLALRIGKKNHCDNHMFVEKFVRGRLLEVITKLIYQDVARTRVPLQIHIPTHTGLSERIKTGGDTAHIEACLAFLEATEIPIAPVQGPVNEDGSKPVVEHVEEADPNPPHEPTGRVDASHLNRNMGDGNSSPPGRRVEEAAAAGQEHRRGPGDGMPDTAHLPERSEEQRLARRFNPHRLSQRPRPQSRPPSPSTYAASDETTATNRATAAGPTHRPNVERPPRVFFGPSEMWVDEMSIDAQGTNETAPYIRPARPSVSSNEGSASLQSSDASVATSTYTDDDIVGYGDGYEGSSRPAHDSFRARFPSNPNRENASQSAQPRRQGGQSPISTGPIPPTGQFDPRLPSGIPEFGFPQAGYPHVVGLPDFGNPFQPRRTWPPGSNAQYYRNGRYEDPPRVPAMPPFNRTYPGPYGSSYPAYPEGVPGPRLFYHPPGAPNVADPRMLAATYGMPPPSGPPTPAANQTAAPQPRRDVERSERDPRSPIFMVLGWFQDELSEPAEICVVVEDSRHFLPELKKHIMALRGWRSIFSFKTVQGFGLYRCRPKQLHHDIEHLTPHDSRTLARFFEATMSASYTSSRYRPDEASYHGPKTNWGKHLLWYFSRYQDSLEDSEYLARKDSAAWAEWVHCSMNNAAEVPFHSSLSLRLVLKVSRPRIAFAGLMMTLLSFVVGLWFMGHYEGVEGASAAWTIASYVLTAGAFITAILAVYAAAKDGGKGKRRGVGHSAV